MTCAVHRVLFRCYAGQRAGVSIADVSWLLSLLLLCGPIGCGDRGRPAVMAPATSSPTASGHDPNEKDLQTTGMPAEYVGTKACVECHTSEHASYAETGHSRSFSTVDVSNQPEGGEFSHQESRRLYRVTKRDGNLWHQELAMIGDEPKHLSELPMRYAVGSGRFGQSYLAEADGFLVQSPITRYTSRREWAMSPGYDRAVHASFERIVSADCLFCHSGTYKSIDHNPFRARIEELAISCERCHGPGEQHVRKYSGREPDLSSNDTIVNPAELPRAAAEAVCSQCHLQGDAQVLVSRQPMEAFRPGMLIERFRLDYFRTTDSPQMTIVGHVEQMHRSDCWQKSDSLTCITCHKGHRHGEGGSSEKSTWYRSVCLQCHTLAGCSESMQTRQQKASDNCLQCHMPKSDTEVPHVAFTDHRIGLHSRADKHVSSTRKNALLTYQSTDHLSLPEQRRARGLAHMQLIRQSHTAQEHGYHKAQATRLLREAYKSGERDGDLLGALAELAWQDGDLTAAERLATDSLKTTRKVTSSGVQAIRILAGLRFRQSRFDEAAELYRQLVEARRDAKDWFYLGLAEQNCDRTEQAIAALHKSLEVSPWQAAAPSALAALYRLRGADNLAQEQIEWATLVKGMTPSPPNSR